MQSIGSASDPRQHQGSETRRAARLSIEGAWHDCSVLDISPGGARILLGQAIAPGTVVVLADEVLGLVAGTVSRSNGDGLSLTFGIAPEASGELLDRLTALLEAGPQD